MPRSRNTRPNRAPCSAASHPAVDARGPHRSQGVTVHRARRVRLRPARRHRRGACGARQANRTRCDQLAEGGDADARHHVCGRLGGERDDRVGLVVATDLPAKRERRATHGCGCPDARVCRATRSVDHARRGGRGVLLTAAAANHVTEPRFHESRHSGTSHSIVAHCPDAGGSVPTGPPALGRHSRPHVRDHAGGRAPDVSRAGGVAALRHGPGVARVRPRGRGAGGGSHRRPVHAAAG